MRNQHLMQICSFILVVAMAPATVSAQTMYRCGTVFQDKPCDNGQQGKVIGTNRTSNSSQSSAKPALDLSCARRGEEAKKIIWSREGGASAEKLMAEASSGEQRRLIANVYAIRGNSADVRSAIENECMAEKTRERQGGYLDNEYGGSQTRNDEKKASSPSSQEKNPAIIADENAIRNKRALCENLNSQIKSIRDQQRAGGDSRTMDGLNRQKYDLESALRSSDCNSM